MDSTHPQTTPVFELTAVDFAYDRQVNALQKINLTIAAGERLAILGSNGSGKSTLLKLLDGLYFPNSGSIQAFGKTMSETAFQNEPYNFEFRRRVGFVFQDSEVQLFMPSVWEEVTFAPLQLNFLPQEVIERSQWALHALRIEKLKDRAPHQLSGGEKKRVALASVLSLMPDVWLLDEPTAGLDPRSVSWLMNFINQQASAGKTIIMATHDLSILETTADRAVVMGEEHCILAEGTPGQILSNSRLLIEANLARDDGNLYNP